MRYKKFTVLLLICLLQVGCLVPSINPLYKTSDLVFDDNLVGTWVDPEEGESLWTFKKSGPLRYTLYITENDDISSFETHLLRIKDYYFIDIFPVEPQNSNDFYNSHLIPTHTFYKVSLKNDRIYASELNYSWFTEQAKIDNIRLEYFKKDDIYVLTDSTENLQDFVLTNIEKCFGGEEVILEKLR